MHCGRLVCVAIEARGFSLETIIGDPYDLQRFVAAQQRVYENACEELRQGSKQSHWMWFIFPQIQGLGHSATAHKFALSSLAEAKAYLEHPLLGARLRECCRLVAAVEGRSIDAIFGSPDNMKFRSSITLFNLAAPHEQLFHDCVRKYFGGDPDPATLAQLQMAKSPAQGE